MHPFLTVFGRQIPTYGLCLVAGIILTCFLSYKSIKRNERNTGAPVRYELLLVIVAVCLFSFILGGKLLYIAVSYDLTDIAYRIRNMDFSFFAEAGMVFYGGLIFGILGSLVAAKITKIDILGIERHIVPYIPLGHAIGRIGCLLGGCCYGMRYDGFGAVYYKDSLLGLSPDVGYFPVQPLESVLDIGITIMLLYYSKKKRPRGNILFAYLLMYSIMRITTEHFRGDAHRGIFSGISTSQWISIGLIILYLLRMVFQYYSEKKFKKK